MDICYEVAQKKRSTMQDPLEFEMALRAVKEFNPKVTSKTAQKFTFTLPKDAIFKTQKSIFDGSF